MNERWTPHATVATIVEQDGKFLMVEEIALGEQVINQPAGHIEPGETVVDAAAVANSPLRVQYKDVPTTTGEKSSNGESTIF